MDAMQIAIFVAGQLVTAGAIYGGIRTDIKNIYARLDASAAAAATNGARLDALLLSLTTKAHP